MSRFSETDPASLKRVQDVFHRALSLDGHERSNYLKEAARYNPGAIDEVIKLLRHHDPHDTSFAPLCQHFESHRPTPTIEVGSLVGTYRLTHKIESGGTGTVWVGERADGLFDQRVAVKLLSWGLVSAKVRQRFDAERRTLAQLEHPYVARLIDGGTTSGGISYLVMEHVEGMPINDYCDKNTLGLKERLALFCEVCDAVRYAHHHLVVHCDLTPNNILVTDGGKPKLVDFGLSRLLADVADESNSDKAPPSRAFTPVYASPEQIRGESLTTATDVFSLGVILSELLTNSDRSSPQEQSRWPNDLRCIVDRATHRDPRKRYALVEHFCDDVKRFLTFNAVSAHPQTLRYRFRKFVVRHKVASVMTVALALSVIVGSIGMTIALLRANENARAATLARDEATATASFLTDVLVSVDPANREFKGANYTVRELIDDASKRLPSTLADFPVVQARVMSTLGQTYRSLGMHHEAEALLHEVLTTEENRPSPERVRIAVARRELGELLLEASRLEEADEMLTSALELLDEDSENNPIERAATLESIGRLESARGLYDDAEATFQDALGIREVHSAEIDIARTLHLLGRTLLEKADYAKSIDPLRKAYELRLRLLGERHALTGGTMSLLGYSLAETNKVSEARELLSEAVAIQREQFGDNRLGLAESLNLLALFHSRRGDREQADIIYRELLDIYQAFLPPDHADLAGALNNLGQNLRAQGRYEEAAPVIQLALDILIKNHGTQHPTVATVMANLGSNLWRTDRLEEAYDLIEKCYEIRKSLYGDTHAHTLESIVELSALHVDLGEFTEAERLASRCLADSLKIYPTAVKRAVRLEVVLARAYVGQKKFNEAERMLKSAHARAIEALDPQHPISRHVVRYLVKLYEAWGDPEQAHLWQKQMEVENSE